MQKELGISNNTVVHWCSLCTEVCVEVVEKLDCEQIKGHVTVVEIDKSKFGKQKISQESST